MVKKIAVFVGSKKSGLIGKKLVICDSQSLNNTIAPHIDTAKKKRLKYVNQALTMLNSYIARLIANLYNKATEIYGIEKAVTKVYFY